MNLPSVIFGLCDYTYSHYYLLKGQNIFLLSSHGTLVRLLSWTEEILHLGRKQLQKCMEDVLETWAIEG